MHFLKALGAQLVLRVCPAFLAWVAQLEKRALQALTSSDLKVRMELMDWMDSPVLLATVVTLVMQVCKL